MEIISLPKNSLKIKGKNSVLIVDPKDNQEAGAGLILSNTTAGINKSGVDVVIEGPGEFEIGGIKITATRFDEAIVFSLVVDSVSILIGEASILEKFHQKFKEFNILIVKCDNETEITSLASLVTNVIIFYSDNAAAVSKSFGSENVLHVAKFASTIDKLPAEVQAIILG